MIDTAPGLFPDLDAKAEEVVAREAAKRAASRRRRAPSVPDDDLGTESRLGPRTEAERRADERLAEARRDARAKRRPPTLGDLIQRSRDARLEILRERFRRFGVPWSGDPDDREEIKRCDAEIRRIMNDRADAIGRGWTWIRGRRERVEDLRADGILPPLPDEDRTGSDRPSYDAAEEVVKRGTEARRQDVETR